MRSTSDSAGRSSARWCSSTTAPGKGNRSGSSTIFRDGPIVRMYYRGSRLDRHAGGYSIPHNYTCYAESDDGLAWTRLDLGMHALEEAEANNIILSGQPALTFTPFLDTNPDCAADQRYKALALRYDPPPRALYGFASADGIRWSQIGDRPLITTGYFDSQNLAFWDATRGEYRAYVRDFHGSRDAAAREVALRDVRTCTSPDFLAWTEPEWLSSEPERFAEIYTNQINPTTAHRTYSSVCRCATSPATATSPSSTSASPVRRSGSAPAIPTRR